jgi:hypothetical protein
MFSNFNILALIFSLISLIFIVYILHKARFLLSLKEAGKELIEVCKANLKE